MFEKISKKINWVFLYNLSQLPTIKQSIIFLVIVPFIAKLKQIYMFPFPFNLLILYISAIFFFLAKVLITLFLPSFLKNNYTFERFKKNHNTLSDLYTHINIDTIKELNLKQKSEHAQYSEVYNYFNLSSNILRIIIILLFILGFSCLVLLFIDGGINVYKSI